MILLANSTPMVCDDKTLHSFLTKRCKRHDLLAGEALVSDHASAHVALARVQVETHLPEPLGPSNIILAR